MAPNNTSPVVRWNLKNENVRDIIPMLGVSYVAAVTTKGKYRDPSDVISSYSQFQEEFGNEIVPDGSVSNIETALNLGSRLRISRVEPPGAEYGYTHRTDNVTTGEGDLQVVSGGDPFLFDQGITLMVENSDTTNPGTMKINILFRTKEPGRIFEDGQLQNGHYTLLFDVQSTQLLMRLFLSSTKASVSTITNNPWSVWLGTFTAGIPPYQIPYITDARDNLLNLYGIEMYLDPNTVEVTGVFTEYNFQTIDEFQQIASNLRCRYYIATDSTGVRPADRYSVFIVGDDGQSGSEIRPEDWIAAVEPFRDYTEGYQLGLSHITQHITEDTELYQVYSYVKDLVDTMQEYVFYIDMPKYNSAGDPMSNMDMESYAQTMKDNIGYSPFIAYFAGGWRYLSTLGSVVSCDNLGTVLGLGDASATLYGPWRPFSGQRRGINTRARGIVSPNYGSKGNYSILDSLAKNQVNLSVIKGTRTSGNVPMLWHNFTSVLENSSFRFLGVIRLVLYIKKRLTPILESYLEEPNTFSTWKDIFYEVEPILQNLVTNDAIFSFIWQGDQDVNRLQDLVVNTEADVRNGKYKVNLILEEVTPIEDLEMNLSMSRPDNQTSVTYNLIRRV